MNPIKIRDVLCKDIITLIVVNLLLVQVFNDFFSLAQTTDDCGYGNITEICCNDYGCCWSTNDTAFAPIGCFNISEIIETTSTIMTTTTNLYTTTTTVPSTTSIADTTTTATTAPTTISSAATTATTIKTTATNAKINADAGSVSDKGTNKLETTSPMTEAPMTTAASGSGGGATDPYTDPVYSCFKTYPNSSYSSDITFLRGSSFTKDQCYQTCFNRSRCMAFQVSRSGSGVCGIFETVLDPNNFQESSMTTIYTFNSSCKKPDLATTCSMNIWYNSTVRCTGGLVSQGNIKSEEECKAYCACELPNCMSAVVRNVSNSVECFIVMEGADLSNFQFCNVAVKQFISAAIDPTQTGGGSGGSGTVSNGSGSYDTQLCWKPPLVENADSDLYKDQYGMAVIYTCKLGYKFPSGERVRTLICDKQIWASIHPRCVPITCSYSNTVYQPFEEIEKSCPDSPGSAYFANGRKTEKSKCTVKNLIPYLVAPASDCVYGCESPLLIYNTTANYNPPLEKVEYTCIKGHRFPDGKTKRTVQCFDNGSWPETDPCSALFCDEIEGDRNLDVGTRSTIFGTVVILQCKTGFMFPMNKIKKVLECVENYDSEIVSANWNDTTAESCSNVICPPPPTNDTSGTTDSDPNILTKGSYNFQDQINFKCYDPNFKFDDGTKQRQLLCTETGLWNFDNVHCGVGRCDPIAVVPNAKPSSILALKDSNVTITCDVGYWFEKNVTTMWTYCDGTKWTTLPYSKCILVTCPVEGNETSTWNTTDIELSYNMAVTIDCDIGHYFYGTEMNASRTVTCTTYGNWSDDIKCVPVNCGQPLPVERASTIEEQPSTLYNSILHYECLPGTWFGRDGYKLVAVCDENGKWRVGDSTNSKNWRPCQDISCLTLVAYVTNNLTSNVGSSGNVTCPEGRKFKDVSDTSILVQCKSNGNWVPTIPECVAVGKTANLTITEAPKADVIAGVSIAIVTIEIACLVAIDLPLLKMSVQYFIKNIKKIVKR